MAPISRSRSHSPAPDFDGGPEISTGGVASCKQRRRRKPRPASPPVAPESPVPTEDGSSGSSAGCDGGPHGGPPGRESRGGEGGGDGVCGPGVASGAGGDGGGGGGDGEEGAGLRDYLRRVGDMQKEALSRIYRGAVENPCQRVVHCEERIEEQFSHLNCQQLPFLEFLSPDKSAAPRAEGDSPHHDDGNDYDPSSPPGRHNLGPRHCEYCGSPSTSQCPTDGSCQRPRLYFLKRRPPFAPDLGDGGEAWDSETEYQSRPPEHSGARWGETEGRGLGALGGGARYLPPGPPEAERGGSAAAARGGGGDRMYRDRRGRDAGGESEAEAVAGWTRSMKDKINGTRMKEGTTGWMTAFF